MRVCRPQREVPCDAPLRRGSACHPAGTTHTADAPGCTGRGCASRHGHTCGVQPGHGRTSRSVWPPPWRAPRRTCPSVSLGQPGYEQGRLGFVGTVPPPFVLASSVSFVSVQARKAHSLHCSSSSHKAGFVGALKRKATAGGGPTMASLDSLGNFNDTLRSYSHSIHRTLMFSGGREIPAAPNRGDGRCAGWNSPCPRRSSPRA